MRTFKLLAALVERLGLPVFGTMDSADEVPAGLGELQVHNRSTAIAIATARPVALSIKPSIHLIRRASRA